MFNKIIISFLILGIFVSCGGSDKFKNPPADDGQASAGDGPRGDGTPTENAPEEKNKNPDPATDNNKPSTPTNQPDTDGYISIGVDPYDPCDEEPERFGCSPDDYDTGGSPLPGGNSGDAIGGPGNVE